MGQPRIGATRFHSSGRYSHDGGACCRRDDDADSDESVEIDSCGDGSSENELVQVRAEVLFAEFLEDAEPIP
jgi:hypothetical protein